MRAAPGACPLMRSPGVSPTRGDPNIAKVETLLIGLVVHEVGHSFGRLGDVYVRTWTASIRARYPNVASDFEGDTCEDKWGDLFGVVVEAPGTWLEAWPSFRTVGCYEGASAVNWYRPTDRGCVMFSYPNHFPFCLVCDRHLTSLMELYSP